jgi:predicted nucleic acid-binding protein
VRTQENGELLVAAHRERQHPQALPSSPVVETTEILEFIENYSLMGRGLGYVDIHLLASAIIGNVVLWTFDRRLHEAAAELGISYSRR